MSRTTAKPAAAAGAPLLEPLRREAKQLDPGARTAMERTMGTPFGDVVVHAGPASAAAADRLDAAAFTVGRHIVFGAGRFNPAATRGRMLLAHELAHVAQQRRGGGDLDLGDQAAASALPLHAGHAEAGSATATFSGPGGATAVGIARQTKTEEDSAWVKAMKGSLRTGLKSKLGQVEAVPTWVAGAVDALVSIPYAGMDAVDAGVKKLNESDLLGPEAKAALTGVVAQQTMSLRLLRAGAQSVGLADQVTGQPSLTVGVGKAGDWAEKQMDSTLFSGMAPEEGYFTSRELNLLATTLAIDVGLSFVAAEEFVLAMKVLGGANAAKAIYEAVMADKAGFYRNRNFWVAVASALLYLVSVGSGNLGKKIIAVVCDVLSSGVAVANAAIQLGQDLMAPDSPERDKAVKADIKALFQAVFNALQQFAARNGRPGAKKDAAAGTAETPAQKSIAPHTDEPVRKTAPPPETAAPKPVTNTDTAPPKVLTPHAESLSAKPAPVAEAPVLTAKATAPTAQTTGAEPGTAPAATTKLTPSEAKRRAEAGDRMLAAAKEKVGEAASARQAAGDRVTQARDRLDQAKAAIDERQVAGRQPTKKQAEELRIAGDQFERAQLARTAARKQQRQAKTGFGQANDEAQLRQAAQQQSLDAAAAKSAKSKSKPTDPGQAELNDMWGKARPEIWKRQAADELAARKAGTSKQEVASPERAAQLEEKIKAAQKNPPTKDPNKTMPTDWDPLQDWDSSKPKEWQGFEKPELERHPTDPLKDLTDAQLAEVAKSGEFPAGSSPEIEHRIGQRVSSWLVKAGVAPKAAADAGMLTNPANLEPTTAGWHGASDSYRRQFEEGTKKAGLSPALDNRIERPLGGATNAEIAGIIKALKDGGADLAKPVTRERTGERRELTWRDILAAEKARRGASATWEVP